MCEETQVLEHPSAFARALRSVAELPKLQISTTKLEELNKRKKKQGKQAVSQRTYQRQGGNTSLEIVDCQCGSKDEDDNSVVSFHRMKSTLLSHLLF
jgi:hypothetical protein